MTLELIREHCYPDRTEGRLSIDGIFEAFSLEPPRRAENPLIQHPAIPAGEYGVTIRYSVKHQCMLPSINHVPGRSDIEIHAGNVAPRDTLGCILIGQRRGDASILNSQDAVHSLMVKLAQELSRQKPVSIVIEDPTGVPT